MDRPSYRDARTHLKTVEQGNGTTDHLMPLGDCFFCPVGISLVEEDDCNNFRRERVLQKVYKGGSERGERS